MSNASQTGRTPDGKMILGQPPNGPIVFALAASVIACVFLWVPYLNVILTICAFGGWFTWSWLEIFQGINYFRRIIGGFVMILLFAAALFVLYAKFGHLN